jgi:N-acetylglucosaminyldiphosphoundecaprenol N-acetyl-beta-D-mannosaminyltransferase
MRSAKRPAERLQSTTIDRQSGIADHGEKSRDSAKISRAPYTGATESHAKVHDILGTHFSLLSYTDVVMRVIRWRDTQEKHYITLTPPYSVLMSICDSRLREATEAASLTLPDGVGIILAAKLLHYTHCGRVTGPELMLRLCDLGQAEGLRHFFYGGAPGVADALAKRLKQRYPGLDVAGTCCPPFRELTPAEDLEILELINQTRPDVVWVGLGSPKQEKWMVAHVGLIDAAALIGVGAAFDFHSGRVRWAPAWVRKMGLEWAYRLATEPKRMWRRNVGSLVFLGRVLHQRVAGANGTRPSPAGVRVGTGVYQFHPRDRGLS